jgi:UDP-2,3-diacylglucosamine pyrophosphatase LpxH
MKSKKYAVLNDIHGPWHDPRLVMLVIDILEDLSKDSKGGLDGIYLNGDVHDFHNINRHKDKKNPAILTSLDDTFYWSNNFFDDLRKRFVNKGTFVHFLKGNHDIWLDDYILKNAPAFWNICQLEKMVNLEGITVTDYNRPIKVPGARLKIQHSPPSYAKTGPFTSLLDKHDYSFIWGCTHRIGHAQTTGESGEVYHGWFNGWLSNIRLSEEHYHVFKYKKDHRSWANCFSIVNVIDDRFFVNQYMPVDYKVVVEGFLYEG